MDIQKETDLLRNVPMFAKLDPSKLKLLAFTSQRLHFEDGEILFNDGDRADCAYVIMSGEVEIVANSEGTPFVAGTLGANQLFGELGVLTGAPRSATIRARGELVAMRMNASTVTHAWGLRRGTRRLGAGGMGEVVSTIVAPR